MLKKKSVFKGWNLVSVYVSMIATGCAVESAQDQNTELWAQEDEGLELVGPEWGCTKECATGDTVDVLMLTPRTDIKVTPGQEIALSARLEFSRKLRAVRAEFLNVGKVTPHKYGLPQIPQDGCGIRVRSRTIKIPNQATPGTKYLIKVVAVDCGKHAHESQTVTATVCAPGDAVCNPPPDAGTDSGRPDAGTDSGRLDAGTDSGRPDAGPPSGGACLSPDFQVLGCAPQQILCYDYPFFASRCQAPTEPCNYAYPNPYKSPYPTFFCDGPEDCMGYQCLASNSSSACFCPGHVRQYYEPFVLCHSDEDCVGVNGTWGSLCCPANYGPFSHSRYSYCGERERELCGH